MQFRLVKTSRACPEQYDVFLGEDKVGYLRLRHGMFRAELYPSGEVVFRASPLGDGLFEKDERAFYLKRACDKIWLRLSKWYIRFMGPKEEVYFVVEGYDVDY